MDQLRLATSLFAALDAGGVTYTQWKSSEHLAAALRGETDLDLLVDPDDRGPFIAVIDGLGFVAMVAAPQRRIPGTESFLGFDEETGALLHLDVQYRLVVGERLLKNHHLPVEDWLLAGDRRQDGVRVPAPERELTMLYVRAMLKTTNRQMLRSRVRGGTPLPDRVLVEARWLVERTEPTTLAAAVTESGLDIDPDEVVDFRRRVGNDELDWRYVSQRRSGLRRRLRSRERVGFLRAALFRLSVGTRSSSLGRRLGMSIPPRRLGPPAPVIAAIGADGSGKSRLTADLSDWLGRKLDVRHVYFGQPKRGLTWKLLNKPGSTARRRGTEPGKLARWSESAKWVWLARRRASLASRARADAANGVVVVAERYPLPDFESMEAPMDGPRLQGTGSPWATMESAAYRSIPPPDLTLVLDADIEVLRSRKIDLGMAEHQAKVAAVKDLPATPSRLVIDAGPPYERVLLEAKTAAWKAIRETH